MLLENRHGLVVDAELTTATETAERDAAVAMATTIATRRQATLGGDNAYDTHEFVAQRRCLDTLLNERIHVLGYRFSGPC